MSTTHDTTTTKRDRDTIELETPITRGETTIKAIELRRPLAGELRGISLMELVRMDVNALLTLLPRITEPPLIAQEVARMDPADLTACGMYLSGYLVPQALQAELPQM